MAFYFAKIWFADSAAKLVLIAAVLVAKISAANSEREKGKQESKIEIAKKLLDDGMDVSKVAKLTNLSVKEVTALA